MTSSTLGSPLPAAPYPPVGVVRGPRLSRWLLAAALTLHALVALAQPVLIGGYLEGRFDLLQVHGVTGSLLTGTAFVALGAAVVYWARRGVAWPVVATASLWVAEWVQLVLGYTRVLWVHVLLGALIVGAAVVLAVWGWSRSAGRARRGWWA